MFPNSSPKFRRFASLHRLLSGSSSPISSVLSNRSDFPTFVLPRLACTLLGNTMFVCDSSMPPPRTRKTAGIVHPVPTGIRHGNGGISQVPVNPQYPFALVPRLRSGRLPQTIMERRCCPPVTSNRETPTINHAFRSSIAGHSD
jgi:hypothetical protein